MRLIDADKLIAHLEDEIDGCKIPFGSRANGKGIAYGTALGLKSAISFAKTAPTVDTKTEVAREIFAEIEKNIQAKINSIPVDEWEDDFFTGERSALVKLAHDIAELKNKYIGGVWE